MRAFVQALRSDSDDQDTQAASELERTFNKEQFRSMIIHGQFNHGFIMASSGLELFIIDQHAADEKFTFERLQDSLHLNKCALHSVCSAAACVACCAWLVVMYQNQMIEADEPLLLLLSAGDMLLCKRPFCSAPGKFSAQPARAAAQFVRQRERRLRHAGSL
jgi:hypothetical protein